MSPGTGQPLHFQSAHRDFLARLMESCLAHTQLKIFPKTEENPSRISGSPFLSSFLLFHTPPSKFQIPAVSDVDLLHWDLRWDSDLLHPHLLHHRSLCGFPSLCSGLESTPRPPAKSRHEWEAHLVHFPTLKNLSLQL